MESQKRTPQKTKRPLYKKKQLMSGATAADLEQEWSCQKSKTDVTSWMSAKAKWLKEKQTKFDVCMECGCIHTNCFITFDCELEDEVPICKDCAFK